MANTMANCSYVSPVAHNHELQCSLCQEVIAPGGLVRQGCSCQLLSCGNCLLTWAETRRQLDPPCLPTCFRCMETLDLSRLRPGSNPKLIELAEETVAEKNKIVGKSVIAALDELDEEDFKANRRRGNIILMSLVSERQEALDNQHQGFAGQATQHNTFFLEAWAPAGGMFMIRGEYRVSNKVFWYFFWVHAATEVGELGEQWERAEFGVRQRQSTKDMLSIAATWHFGALRMDWTDRVGELGMVDGSSFFMFTPEPEFVDLRSPS